MELVECPRDSAATPVARLGTFICSILEKPAYAGHAIGTPNPAAIHPMQVESLTNPTTHEVGAVLLSPQRYCQLHYLVARAGRVRPGCRPDGLVSIETIVDVSRPGPAVTSLFGFRDEVTLRNFIADPASADLWNQFDAFVGPHGHHAADRPLIYQAPQLSAK